MKLQLTAPTAALFSQLRIILMALVGGFLLTAMVAPQGILAAETTDEDTQLVFTVTPSPGYTISGLSGNPGDGPFHGSATISGNEITYDPDPDFFGSDELHYDECDTNNVCTKVQVDITVNSVNDIPVAVDDPASGNEAAYTMLEDSGTLIVPDGATDLLTNDTDVELDPLTAVIDTPPSNGSVMVNPDGSFVYTPTLNFNGNDSFTYVANDGADDSLPATVMLTVTAVADNVELYIPSPISPTLIPTPTSSLITVPVYYSDPDAQTISLNFDLNFDTSCLLYDDISFAPQAASATTTAVETAPGLLKFAIFDVGLTPLNDGLLADVVFEFDHSCVPSIAGQFDLNELWFANIVPSDSTATQIPDTPNSAHVIPFVVNTAPDNVKRPLVNGNGNNETDEGFAGPGIVAMLETEEASPGDPHVPADHSYSLEDTGCNGAANLDNADFEILNGNELHAKAGVVFDYETKDKYKLCIRSTDPLGAYFDKVRNIRVGDVDEAPLAILVDGLNAPGPVAVDENAPAMTMIANLSVDEVDINDSDPMSHTYQILSVTSVTGTVPTDYFTVTNGISLTTGIMFNHEASESYTVTVRAIDVDDPYSMTVPPTLTLYVDADITVNITDINEPAAGVLPVLFEVDETAPVNTSVGSVAVDGDPDADDIHTYAFCGGALVSGDFAIDPNTGEITTTDLMPSAPASLPLCVEVDDDGTNPDLAPVPTAITIDVVNGNHPPEAIDDTFDPADWVVVGPDLYSVAPSSLTKFGPANLQVLGNDSDPDGDPFNLMPPIGPSTPKGTVLYMTNQISYTAPAPVINTTMYTDYAGVDTFAYSVMDNKGAHSVADATVELNYVMAHDRGDCNADGSVDSNDFVLGVLEYFEFTGVEWYEINTAGSAHGSPWGCNSVQDLTIDILDVMCSVNIFFGNSCGGSVLASSVQAPASLSIASDLSANGGETVNVPIVLGNGANVAGAGFFVQVDSAKLAFDATDADGDGLPDAVSLNLPAATEAIVDYDAASGELKFAIFGKSLPMASLQDGTIATVTYQVADGASGDSAVELTNVSFSDSAAQSVDSSVNSGSVEIGPSTTGSSFDANLYLPLMLQ